jgi:hypothetical protein
VRVEQPLLSAVAEAASVVTDGNWFSLPNDLHFNPLYHSGFQIDCAGRYAYVRCLVVNVIGMHDEGLIEAHRHCALYRPTHCT